MDIMNNDRKVAKRRDKLNTITLQGQSMTQMSMVAEESKVTTKSKTTNVVIILMPGKLSNSTTTEIFQED